MPRRSTRFTAWLGILAILLTVLVPVGSQWVKQASRSADVLCSAVAHHAAHASGAHDHAPDDPAAAHFEACAYCGLLAHLPALTPAPRLTATTARLALDAHTPPRTSHCIRNLRYVRRPSRAPPLDA
jgi:hypothetical protein